MFPEWTIRIRRHTHTNGPKTGRMRRSDNAWRGERTNEEHGWLLRTTSAGCSLSACAPPHSCFSSSFVLFPPHPSFVHLIRSLSSSFVPAAPHSLSLDNLLPFSSLFVPSSPQSSVVLLTRLSFSSFALFLSQASFDHHSSPSSSCVPSFLDLSSVPLFAPPLSHCDCSISDHVVCQNQL